jgi:hypothetical protein
VKMHKEEACDGHVGTQYGEAVGSGRVPLVVCG